MALSSVKRYMAEFKFYTPDETDSFFWLPVIINASSLASATEIETRLGQNLRRAFVLTGHHDVRDFRYPLVSEALKPIATSIENTGEIQRLSLLDYAITDFGKPVTCVLSQPVHIVPQTLLSESSYNIEGPFHRLEFPATQVAMGADLDKDYLVLKVTKIS